MLSPSNFILFCLKSKWHEPLKLAADKNIQSKKIRALLQNKVLPQIGMKDISDKMSMVRQIGTSGRIDSPAAAITAKIKR